MQNLDWFTVFIYVALVFFGWLCIYGAVYNFEDKAFWDFSERYGKQLVWIGFACAISCVILMVDSRVYNVFSYPLYGLSILLLLLTLAVAPDIKGSRSWLVLGPVNLQPAEFAKTATCLALAKFMSSYGFQSIGFRWSNFKNILFLGVIAFLPMLIIILQQETGSALVYCSLLLVMYREGMSGLILFLVLCCVVFFIVAIRFGEDCIIAACPDESLGIFMVLILAVFIAMCMAVYYYRDSKYFRTMFVVSIVSMLIGTAVYKLVDYPVKFSYIAYFLMAVAVVYLFVRFFVLRKLGYVWISLFIVGSVAYANMADYVFDNVLQPHQQTRIMVTLGMKNDPKKSGYNVNQSKIAIGSGGAWGKGFLNGTQTKLKYVPEQDTDFIFCTVGEEHGFLGSIIVLGLFLALLLRLIFLAERQRSLFSRIYGYCVASIFFFHLAINVGMVTGLTPVIGIPLPFFSYGGSSLWGFTILLFIFLRLDASRMEYMQD